jgi:hypothetical protein
MNPECPYGKIARAHKALDEAHDQRNRRNTRP